MSLWTFPSLDKKIRLRSEGIVPASSFVTHVGALLGALCGAYLILGEKMKYLFFPESIKAFALEEFFFLLALPCLLYLVLAFVISLLQTKFLLFWEGLSPDLTRVSPFERGRFLPGAPLALLASLLLGVLFAFVLYVLFAPGVFHFLTMTALSFDAALATLSKQLFLAVSLILSFSLVLGVLLTWLLFQIRHRMTDSDLREEQ